MIDRGKLKTWYWCSRHDKFEEESESCNCVWSGDAPTVFDNLEDAPVEYSEEEQVDWEREEVNHRLDAVARRLFLLCVEDFNVESLQEAAKYAYDAAEALEDERERRQHGED